MCLGEYGWTSLLGECDWMLWLGEEEEEEFFLIFFYLKRKPWREKKRSGWVNVVGHLVWVRKKK